MKIGVVCEGPTDFIAIKEFFGSALTRELAVPQFVPLQPRPDNTDDGGWTRVVFWLDEHDPQTRVSRFLDGSIFASGLDQFHCDALIIHMDTDVLDQPSFLDFMGKREVAVLEVGRPLERGEELRRVLLLVSRMSELTEGDQQRHVIAPAVESTEAWCVAAFERVTADPETYAGQSLWDAFGSCLLRSEGITSNHPPKFGPPDKSVARRAAFCSRHRASAFLLPQCASFRKGVEALQHLQ
jgi:hypothetical protein